MRTNIGQEAVNRLQILKDAIRLMNDERVLCTDEYPKEFYHIRINDALILTLDLPSFFTPSVGESIRKGFSANELDQFFDLDSIGSDEEFEQAYVTKLSKDTADLVRFVGLIARIHHYVNRKENAAYFPGAKTVVASGYRRTFFADGKEDFLAANVSFSNAYLAEKDLHGSNLFLDNNIVQLLCANPSILAYLQVIPRLSIYLRSERKPKAASLWLSVFEAMKKGPSQKALNSDTAPKFFRGPILQEDIENDIRIFSEIVESGDSTILKEQREKSLREHMLKAPNPS